MEDKIQLSVVNLTPTMKCNLKCRLCGVLVPQYEYRPQMDRKEFKETLNALFELADHVGRLQITGGEPLVHSELADFLEDCFAYSEQFDELWLFCNCAVPMKKEVTEVLERHKDQVFVHASDYGVRSELAKELVKMLEANKIRHRYLKYYGEDQYCDGWVDQGDFIKHGRNEEELKEVFSHCTHVKRGGSWYIRGGQIHWCGRSIRGTEVGKIPVREGDYLDLFKGTLEEKRRKFKDLRQAEYILACDYCNGDYGTEDKGRRHPAGEQE